MKPLVLDWMGFTDLDVPIGQVSLDDVPSELMGESRQAFEREFKNYSVAEANGNYIAGIGETSNHKGERRKFYYVTWTEADAR